MPDTITAPELSPKPPDAPAQAAPSGKVVAPGPAQQHKRRWWLKLAAVLLVLGGGAAGGAYWWTHRPPGLPLGIAFSNGRIEADEIDISTKFAGRISEIHADEGDLVREGQVVARIDTRDLATQLAAAQSQTKQAQQTIVQNQSDLDQMAAQLKFDSQQLNRAQTLLHRGYGTQETVDQRQSTFSTATAQYSHAQSAISDATAGLESKVHDANLIQVNINDDTLVSPKDGPIEYRLANVGEVLPVGGKVFTILDVTYVYMDIYLPTEIAGRIKFGDDARIVLDALPNRPVPARVTSVASHNEFTPKAVETKSDRDKLMFRIRVRIDPALLRRHELEVRSGLPGLTYIRFNSSVAWPAFLEDNKVK